MSQKSSLTQLSDIGSERAVISGVCQYGIDAMVDVADILSANSFTNINNQLLFRCLEEILSETESVDVTGIITTSTRMGVYDKLFATKKDTEYIRSIFNFPIKKENVRIYAKRIAKLEFARKACNVVKDVYDKLTQLDGSESIDHILSIPENAIFDLVFEVNREKEDGPILITDGAKELLEELMNNPSSIAGLPTPWPHYNTAIGGGFRRGGVNLISSRPKGGKMQPYDSHIYTPSGLKMMGEIKVGDEVCSSNGNFATVTHVFNHGEQDVYKITFSDGDFVECGLEHLWKVKKNRRDTNYKVLNLKQILDNKLTESDGRPKWHIPLPEPVYFQSKQTKLDPYLMGLLLGDGNFRGVVSITSADQSIINYCQSKLLDNYKLREQGKCTYVFSTGKRGNKNFYTDVIKHYNLWNKKSEDKFIPLDYMYNDINCRKELLRGLLDSDGNVTHNGGIEYSTKSYKLALNVKWLVQSLGGLCNIKQRITHCNNKPFLSYRLRIRFNNNQEYFNLGRKKILAKKRTKNTLTRTIKSVEYIGRKKCKCIKVDSPEELYLTDNFIVTHNSTISKDVALHCVLTLNIPVLVLDTEMSKNDALFRSLASMARVETNKIETGQFGSDEQDAKAIFNMLAKLEGNPNFWYKGIAGKPFPEVLSIIRRWILQKVGHDESGRINDCLIIYDYFKLMSEESLKSLQEYQAIGFQISHLSDFCKEYDFPCLAFVQLNREEDISQSDRLRWLCHSYSRFRRKTPEEIAEDGIENGNRKMTIEDARYGPGLVDDYIDMELLGDISKVIEIGLNSNKDKRSTTKQQGFETNFDEDDVF